MPHKLAIITVVYENYTVLPDFLSSLRKQTNQNFHLFCIDVSIHRYKITTDDISSTVISAENKGYAYGVNLGLKKAIDMGFDMFCVLNNDIFFKKNFIDCVSKSILNNPSSILGGKIYYAPGFEYHKNKYKQTDSGKIIWYAGGEIDWNHALTPHRGVDETDHNQYASFQKTYFVNGAMMLLDKSVIDKIGYWDEKYFLYYEDADYCVRATKSDIKLYYDPSLIIWHKNAQSTGGSGSLLHQKYQKINRLRFGLKYAPIKTKIHLLMNYFFH